MSSGFELFQAADPLIQAHALVAIAAIIVGGVQLALPKGTATHRFIGRAWVAGIALVALSSFGIHEIRLLGPFSPIHLLSILALFGITHGVMQARRGDIAGHRRSMQRLYILALLITGGFTLLPGRLMHGVLFG